MPNMLLEKSGEITPERIKRRSQSENNTQLWMWLVMEVKTNVESPYILKREEVHFLGSVDKEEYGTNSLLFPWFPFCVSKWLVFFFSRDFGLLPFFSYFLPYHHRRCPHLLPHKGNSSQQERTPSEFCHSSKTHLYPLSGLPVIMQ